MPISPATLAFLRQLHANNHRDWFAANRPAYEAAKAEWQAFVGTLLAGVSTWENLAGVGVKDCVFRINRDVRFSKNKDPYKTNLSAAISRGGRHSPWLDYYVHLQPDGGSFLGGGLYVPTPEQLIKLRQEIAYNAAELKAIIHDPTFAAYFGAVKGEVLKTAPKGYDRDHPELPLLQQKAFFFTHSFTDAQVLAPDFAERVTHGFRLLQPFIGFMNYFLFEE